MQRYEKSGIFTTKKAASKFDDCLPNKKKTEDRAGLLSPSCPSGRLLIAPWLSYRDSNSE